MLNKGIDEPKLQDIHGSWNERHDEEDLRALVMTKEAQQTPAYGNQPRTHRQKDRYHKFHRSEGYTVNEELTQPKAEFWTAQHVT